MKILDLIKQYPTDGTHKYHWVNGFDGVTEDLIYKDTVIAKSEELKRTYCCGLTFEIFFKAMKSVDLGTVQDIKKLKADWYVASGKRKGPIDALVPRGLGEEVSREEAKPGDFVQLWRKNGSGHSVILLNINEDAITYWSTQPSTKGIGKRVELFTGKNPVIETHIVRLKI